MTASNLSVYCPPGMAPNEVLRHIGREMKLAEGYPFNSYKAVADRVAGMDDFGPNGVVIFSRRGDGPTVIDSPRPFTDFRCIMARRFDMALLHGLQGDVE